jgi:hypothetical protein
MLKTNKQLTQPELPPQLSQMPSPRMEIKKPKSQKRLWLLTGILVMVFIVIVVAVSQASKSSQSTKTLTQSWYLAHDTHEPLTVGQAQPWCLAHDTHEALTVAP